MVVANFGQEPHTRKDGEGYILVDFDRTLAHYTTWEENGPSLGEPIPAMVERVRRWIAAGREVRIFTARASTNNPRIGEDTVKIQAWCREHIGAVLTVTNEKDFKCAAIWDDIAVTVEPNTGWRWTAQLEGKDPLSYEEEMSYSGYGVEIKEAVDSTEYI